MDITMTAVRRPEIIHKTLSSFANAFNNFKSHRLIVNIDPVGGTLFDEQRVIDICYEFFDNIIVKTPHKASFPKAFNWCWSQIETDIVFHLEDDFVLIQQIDISEILNILDAEPDLALMRLPLFRSGPKDMKTWNKFIPFNGKYFECPKDLRGSVGFCGHPSFIRKEFIDKCLPYLDDNLNPEKIFHRKGGILMEEVMKWRYGIFGTTNNPPIIKDIGREWIAKTNWQKKGNKAIFTEWEEIV